MSPDKLESDVDYLAALDRADEESLGAVVEAEWDVARRIADAAEAAPWARADERIARVAHACAVCGADWPAGTLFLVVSCAFARGRKSTSYVCPLCPEPPLSTVPVHRVDPARLAAHAARTAPPVRHGRRGRPSVTVSREEVALVVELRAAGLGELRVAREFLARTGRRIAARTLARYGRN